MEYVRTLGTKELATWGTKDARLLGFMGLGTTLGTSEHWECRMLFLGLDGIEVDELDSFLVLNGN